MNIRMMNFRMGPVPMGICTAGFVLGCLSLSLFISSDRTEVERLKSRIAADTREVRELETELRTLSRLPVLQQWNDNILALKAPLPKQFVESPMQLAAYAPGMADVVEPEAQLAVGTADTLPATQPVAVALQTVSYTVPLSPVAAADGETRSVRPKAVPQQPNERAAEGDAPPPRPKAEKAKPERVRPEPVRIAQTAMLQQTVKADVKPGKDRKAADPLAGLLDDLDSAAAKEKARLGKVAAR